MPFIAANALAWALKHWKVLLGGAVVVFLTVALILAKSDARHWRKQDAQHVAALSVEVQKNQINLASIDTLQAALAAKNKESDDRAAALAQSRVQDAHDTATADARQSADKSRGEALRALARDLPDSCKAPAAVVAQLKGL